MYCIILYHIEYTIAAINSFITDSILIHKNSLPVFRTFLLFLLRCILLRCITDYTNTAS